MPNKPSSDDASRKAPQEEPRPRSDTQPEPTAEHGEEAKGMPARSPAASQTAMKQEHKTPQEGGSKG